MRRSSTLLLTWIVTVAVSLGAASPQSHGSPPAATAIHRVQPGDSLALLAAEYYGDRRHQVILMAENGLSEDQPLKPKATLRIPLDQELVTDVDDTLVDLAQRYLGDARRARFLVGFSDNLPPRLPVDVPLAAGMKIRVPLHIRQMAMHDEPLEVVARRYFGNPEKARLLREYNFLDEDMPTSGIELLIPVYHVAVHRSRRPTLDEASRHRMLRRAEMQQRAHGALVGARMAWDMGDYAAVQRLLDEVDTRYLDAEQAVELCVLLGSAHVAFGNDELALRVFRLALARNPAHSIDPYQLSPKIRAVWQQAGGAVGSAP